MPGMPGANSRRPGSPTLWEAPGHICRSDDHRNHRTTNFARLLDQVLVEDRRSRLTRRAALGKRKKTESLKPLKPAIANPELAKGDITHDRDQERERQSDRDREGERGKVRRSEGKKERRSDERKKDREIERTRVCGYRCIYTCMHACIYIYIYVYMLYAHTYVKERERERERERESERESDTYKHIHTHTFCTKKSCGLHLTQVVVRSRRLGGRSHVGHLHDGLLSWFAKLSVLLLSW